MFSFMQTEAYLYVHYVQIPIFPLVDETLRWKCHYFARVLHVYCLLPWFDNLDKFLCSAELFHPNKIMWMQYITLVIFKKLKKKSQGFIKESANLLNCNPFQCGTHRLVQSGSIFSYYGHSYLTQITWSSVLWCDGSAFCLW